jgi:hypothetical protein
MPTGRLDSGRSPSTAILARRGLALKNLSVYVRRLARTIRCDPTAHTAMMQRTVAAVAGFVGDRADQLGASHSLSFDHLRPVCLPFTAIAIAFV